MENDGKLLLMPYICSGPIILKQNLHEFCTMEREVIFWKLPKAGVISQNANCPILHANHTQSDQTDQTLYNNPHLTLSNHAPSCTAPFYNRSHLMLA